MLRPIDEYYKELDDDLAEEYHFDSEGREYEISKESVAKAKEILRIHYESGFTHLHISSMDGVSLEFWKRFRGEPDSVVFYIKIDNYGLIRAAYVKTYP